MTEPKRSKLEEQPATTTTTTTTMSVDRISSLPDSLLCHILSFLPIITAISTSILSRRWRHVWEHLQVFTFYDSSALEHKFPSEEDAKFIAFVNAVLTLCRVRHIQKFRLSCKIRDKDVIRTWLRAAIGPHLQELRLDLSMPASEFFFIPRSIFTCTALVSLSLKGRIRVDKLSSVHLPSLKNLEMDPVYVHPLDELFSGCPVLETLKLITYRAITPKICMPSLKSLTFQNHDCGVTGDFEIDTPSLQYLDINLDFLHFSFSNLHNVMEAHVGFFSSMKEHVDVLPKLLRALRRTKFLELKYSATKWLLGAPTMHFPEFCCLLELHLSIPYFNSRFMIELLQNCHMLQALMINNKSSAHLAIGKEISLQTSGWTQPNSVPKCVISHLKTFTFRGYQDNADEREFVAYMLERGLVLKTMKIHSYVTYLDQKHDILRRLSLMPRGSNMCQLEFY